MKIKELFENTEDVILQYLRDSSWFNMALRFNDGKNHNALQSAAVKVLDKAIENSSRSNTLLTLYRAVPYTALEDKKVDDIFTDKGFVSTSSDKKSVNDPGYVHPDDRLVLTIKVPVGIPILDMSEVVKNSASTPEKAKKLADWEKEYLLPRNLSFKIIELSKKKATLEIVK